MMDKYKAEDRGIQIIELEDSFQMCTKPEMYEALIRIAKQPRKYVPVSYTHLDVYKRQLQPTIRAMAKIGVNSSVGRSSML